MYLIMKKRVNSKYGISITSSVECVAYEFDEVYEVVKTQC